jgi:hypothetical protein
MNQAMVKALGVLYELPQLIQIFMGVIECDLQEKEKQIKYSC